MDVKPTTDEWTDPTPVHTAAQHGDLMRLKALVAAGHAVWTFDDLGYTPLHYAAMKGHDAAVEFLLSAGADAIFCRVDALSGLARTYRASNPAVV